MRKLKTWEIVLLVIFYPVGICVLIYRVIRKGQLKKEQEAAQAARALEAQRKADAERAAQEQRREQARLFAEMYDEFTLKVVGVSFKNPGNKSRQAILRKFKFGDPPFNTGSVNVELREYEYQGELALGVFLEGEQVGNIAKEDLPRVLPRMDDFVEIVEVNVTGGGRTSSGETINYGCKIRLRFKKTAPAA